MTNRCIVCDMFKESLFFEKYKVFSPCQHGYRSKKSNITAMIELTEHLVQGYDDMTTKIFKFQ